MFVQLYLVKIKVLLSMSDCVSNLIPEYFLTYGILEGLVGVVALISNLLVILAIIKNPNLRKKTDYLILSLAFSDLFVGIIEAQLCTFVR